MSTQVVERRYRTVAQLAEYLGVGVHVVYRNVKSGAWKCSRTSPGPKAPIRFSDEQTAAIEALMERNGEQGPVQSAPSIEARNREIERAIRRRTRH